MQIADLEAKTRRICEKMAEVKNRPRGKEATPDEISALYGCLDECQRALANLVGDHKADEIVMDLYRKIVRSH